MPQPPPDHRIKDEHRARAAFVYVRQSDPGQVRVHGESTRLQLGLREKALALGWTHPVVIQDDLGVSAAGFADRPGFQRMLTEVALQRVGIILCTDASRLSRNCVDWAHLFQLCGHFHTLVADIDQVYDLAIPNDRLVLGIKGTVAELELSILRNRLRAGAEAKAARGELKFIVPPGYTHEPDGKLQIDPDRRVQHAIRQLFDHFDRCTSVRQLALWYRDSGTLFPVRKVRRTQTLAWEIPAQATLRNLLSHPIYAGTYVYGRRAERVELVDGKLVKRTGKLCPPHLARVCIHDNHPAYISWKRFEDNQRRIHQARPRWALSSNHGAVREGLAMLSGMLRCAHCGSKLYVAYKARSAMYYCDGGAKGARRCLSFGSKLVDQRVADELCHALQPLAIDAAKRALELQRQDDQQRIQDAELRVQAAKYQAERAFEQFDLVDPKNRLVADTLERRLNERLEELHQARHQLELAAQGPPPLSEQQHQKLEQLAADFHQAWNHPKADVTLRKRILRAAIEEIIVLHPPDSQRIDVTIHWRGAVHTRIEVPKRATPVGSKTDVSLIDTVRELAQSLADAEIARILNMKRTTTPRGLPWTLVRVAAFRKTHSIKLGHDLDPDSMTGQQAAHYLQISRNGLRGLIRLGVLHHNQVTDFAPWRIPKSELDSEIVRQLVRELRATGRLPHAAEVDDRQLSLLEVTAPAAQLDDRAVPAPSASPSGSGPPEQAE